MGSVIGLDGKFYRNTGSWGSPTWNLVPNVRDLSTSLDKGAGDVSNRASRWEKVRGTLKKFELTFTMVWDPADADCLAFLDSFLNNTAIDCIVLDGAVTTPGSQGPRGVMEVMKFGRDEKLEEGMMVPVSMKFTYDANGNEPTWYTAS